MPGPRAPTTNRTVIVLGAGASVPDGAPLQKDLFGTYFALPPDPDRLRSIAEINITLCAFFRTFFGIDPISATPLSKEYPTFEEALGIVELALHNEESFRAFASSARDPRLQRVRDALLFLICILLERTLELRGPQHYATLLQTLHESNDLRATTFISFNYEILLDNAITELRRPPCGPDLDYGIDFENFKFPEDDENAWDAPRPGHSVQLLKLHGSLNWLYCSACTSLTLTPKLKGAAWIIYDPERAICKRCGTLAVPLIIPPTYFKAMANFHLRAIWRQAEAALTATSRIVFCGYSLPDADMHVKYLLKRAEVNGGRTPDVYVVNHQTGKADAQADDETSRYRRLFNDPRCVHDTRMSFEEFARGGMRTLETH
jgi:hypothetical protein